MWAGRVDQYAPGGTGLNGEAVGAMMRLARRRLGLSQRALADALSWDRAKVGRWESGRVPEGFEEVVSLARMLGFDLVLRDREPDRWAEWDDPAEHLLDRADRRFPAHLELCPARLGTTWNWTRHRGEPAPHAGMTSFRRQTPGDALEELRRAREWEAERMQSEDDDPETPEAL